jgi:hypothetical protein
MKTNKCETTSISTIQAESSKTSSSLESPTARTLLNPLRCSRRQITLTKTPNLINLSSTPTSSYSSLPQAPAVLSGPIILDLTSTENSDEGMEAFKNVMKKVFETKHF